MRLVREWDLIVSCWCCTEEIEVRLAPQDGPVAYELLQFYDNAFKVYGLSALPENGESRLLVCSTCISYAERIGRTIPGGASFPTLRIAMDRYALEEGSPLYAPDLGNSSPQERFRQMRINERDLGGDEEFWRVFQLYELVSANAQRAEAPASETGGQS